MYLKSYNAIVVRVSVEVRTLTAVYEFEWYGKESPDACNISMKIVLAHGPSTRS